MAKVSVRQKPKEVVPAREALPAGSFYTEPKNVPHFAMAKGEDAILEVTGMGPSGTNYVNPADDPRKK